MNKQLARRGAQLRVAVCRERGQKAFAATAKYRAGYDEVGLGLVSGPVPCVSCKHR